MVCEDCGNARGGVSVVAWGRESGRGGGGGGGESVREEGVDSQQCGRQARPGAFCNNQPCGLRQARGPQRCRVGKGLDGGRAGGADDAPINQHIDRRPTPCIPPRPPPPAPPSTYPTLV